jgi:hypothetical protein
VVLTNQDPVFKEVRDKHFACLDQFFSQKLKEIKNIVQEKDKPTTIDQLEVYIGKLKEMNIAKMKSLVATHINIASHIKNEIHEIDNA